jgi:signal transduction histidine kinase
VLWNLVHNAIKFTDAGGCVTIHSQHANGYLEIAVQDSGRGIGPGFLPHVFERFRQEDASSSSPTAGLGLGLSIAKHLVELHGGTIQAWSPGLGAGSTFVVRMPVTLAAAHKATPGATRSGGVLPASASAPVA